MRAKDLMRTEIFTAHEDTPLDELIEVFVREHIHGVPVLDRSGELVGIVTPQDVFFGAMTRRRRAASRPEAAGPRSRSRALTARDVMTSPAVSASEQTTVRQLCRLMHRLRIHRVPIVRKGKLAGIVSSLDICGALARGEELF